MNTSARISRSVSRTRLLPSMTALTVVSLALTGCSVAPDVDAGGETTATTASKLVPVGELVHSGAAYQLQNGWAGWNGGVLQVVGSGCYDDDGCVATRPMMNPAYGTEGGWWMPTVTRNPFIFSAPASDGLVHNGDWIYLPSGGVEVGTSGYLDTRGRGCYGNELCVATSASTYTRDGYSGVWAISADNLPYGAALHTGDAIHLENLYGFNGGYLDTREYLLPTHYGNMLAVSTATTSNRDSGSGTWRFMPVQ